MTETFQLGRFGQVVVSSGSRLRRPTAVLPASDTAAVQDRQAANDLNRLILDDASQAGTGLLYRTAAVTPVAGATFVDQAGDQFERRPVAQTFSTPVGPASPWSA
ncbi:MAG: hypothetical protein ACRDRX_18165 [Pseudonocardiaceae bacterium]